MNRKGFIFAKVGVRIASHPRFLRIPQKKRAAALGVWTAALCFSRGEELSGWCPSEAIEAIASEESVGCLVDVGLFSRGDEDGVAGVWILKYEQFNDTKEQIDAARLRARAKKTAQRHPHVPEGVPSAVPGDTPGTDRGSPQGSPDSAPVSDSLSSPVFVTAHEIQSDPVIAVPESATVAAAKPAPALVMLVPPGTTPPLVERRAPSDRPARIAPMTHSVAATRQISKDEPITDELREAAKMRGVQDVDHAWAKFTGHNDGRIVPVAGWWQSWCADQVKFESKERSSGVGRKADVRQPINPAGRTWKVGGGEKP